MLNTNCHICLEHLNIESFVWLYNDLLMNSNEIYDYHGMIEERMQKQISRWSFHWINDFNNLGFFPIFLLFQTGSMCMDFWHFILRHSETNVNSEHCFFGSTKGRESGREKNIRADNLIWSSITLTMDWHVVLMNLMYGSNAIIVEWFQRHTCPNGW